MDHVPTTVRLVAHALVILAAASGCGLITGSNKLQKVDCVDCVPGTGTDVTSTDAPLPPAPVDPDGDDTPAQDPTPETPGEMLPDGSAPEPDAASDGGSGAADAGDAGAKCPGTEGPTPVRVGTYCIDATEVTNAHYARFLAAKANGSNTTGQDPWCTWNGSYVPDNWPPGAGRENEPVRSVDWCDASAYCKWAGKRLCGLIGGLHVPLASRNDPKKSQWFSACSNDGTRTYPYGNAYDGTACVGSDNSASVRNVGTYPKCIGGASPDLRDLSGNVWEWEDACESYGASGAGDGCARRGGGYQSGSSNLRCDVADTSRRDERDPDLGFRCCSP